MAKDNDQNLLDSTYDELTEFENFFTKNWVNIIVTGIIIVIAVVAGIQIKSWLEESNTKAGETLSSAKTIEEIEAALKKYPRHKAADFCRLHLASLYFETGNSDKASDILTELAKKTKVKELAAQAELNLAAITLQKGKSEEAAEKYSYVGSNQKFPVNYRIQAKISSAMIYINLGKPSLAKTVIELSNPDEIEAASFDTDYHSLKNIVSSL